MDGLDRLEAMLANLAREATNAAEQLTKADGRSRGAVRDALRQVAQASQALKSEARDFASAIRAHDANVCAIDAAKSAGIWQDQPIRGWDVSCDSRIFACEYPQMTVLTGGPGQLVHAHSDNEQCRIDDIAGFADFLAHYLMRLAGTISQITGKASVNG